MAKDNPAYTLSDVIYALNCAAEFLDNEEFPDGTGAQKAANKDGARRIRSLVKTITRKTVTHMVDPLIPSGEVSLCGRGMWRGRGWVVSDHPTCKHCHVQMKKRGVEQKNPGAVPGV